MTQEQIDRFRAASRRPGGMTDEEFRSLQAAVGNECVRDFAISVEPSPEPKPDDISARRARLDLAAREMWAGK